MTTCVYMTSLDRECGREATTGEHCDFHALLYQLDSFEVHDEIVVIVPESQRDTLIRILSDVRANFDAMPTQPITPRIGHLLGMTTASMRRNEALRQMNWKDRP